MNQNRTYRIMISGGGTGGHIFPAISIAQALEKKLEHTDILFVGAKGKMEMQKVPNAGYKIVGLWISGIQRKLTIQNFTFPFKIFSSLLKSLYLIIKFKPDVVVGVGGYASGPLLYAATLKKIPTLIQEQNSYAGLTNKWLANRVDKICVAHAGMEKYFPQGKIIITGNPVRSEMIYEGERRDALRYFRLKSGSPIVFMTGGSLGARTLNEAMMVNLEKLTQNGVQIIWQCGSFYYQEIKDWTQNIDMSGVWLNDFIIKMSMAYSIADLVISRAGALSIAELELTGKASILIPSPNVAEDHQTKNALSLSERKAAILIKDHEASQKLGDEILDLLKDQKKLNKLEKNISMLAHPEAQRSIADEIIKLVA